MMVTGWDYFFLKRKPNRQFRCKEIQRKHSTRVNGPKDIMAIFCVFFFYMYFIQRRIEGRVDVVSCNRLLQNVYLYFFSLENPMSYINPIRRLFDLSGKR